MRYIYIICLLMSSFFTYKNSFAIFIPQNVFQENVKVNDINSMKPRYEKKEPPKETLSKNSGLVNAAEKPKISLPYVRKPIVAVDDIKAKEKSTTEDKTKAEQISSKPVVQTKKDPPVAPTPPIISDEMKKKLSKYVLDNDFGKEDDASLTEMFNPQAILKKDITKQLTTIPYANRKLPKFQQCYSDYGSDLRVLFHRSKFPDNSKQEAVLAKASSTRRFEVK